MCVCAFLSIFLKTTHAPRHAKNNKKKITLAKGHRKKQQQITRSKGHTYELV
jgi:hypothetical protein